MAVDTRDHDSPGRGPRTVVQLDGVGLAEEAVQQATSGSPVARRE